MIPTLVTFCWLMAGMTVTAWFCAVRLAQKNQDLQVERDLLRSKVTHAQAEFLRVDIELEHAVRVLRGIRDGGAMPQTRADNALRTIEQNRLETN